MPELAEAEFFRKRWHQAAVGRRIRAVELHPSAKVFRGADPAALRRALRGQPLRDSQARAKQMLFRFGGGAWLGVHLGMSGELHVEPAGYIPAKHDHLVLRTAARTLVFTDPRMFGRVQFHHGATAPDWWTRIAPALTSDAFSVAAVAAFLRRRGRAPIKAVLLMQERFPGVGNWMADEILWRECRRVARMALATIAGRGDYLPPDLNAHIPTSWLFRHRWEDGGRCPRTGVALIREEIGGRTTCWSPARQRRPRG